MTRALRSLAKLAVLLAAVCALSPIGSRGITPSYAGAPRNILVSATVDCTIFVGSPVHAGTVGDPDVAGCIRAAILDANANPGSTIRFDPATNNTPQLLLLNNCAVPPAPCVPGVDGGDPTINDIDVTASVTIIGNTSGGLPVTIIDGNGLDKIFSFNPSEVASGCTPATGIQVTLQNLQLQNGKNQRAFSTDCDSEGGAFDFDAGLDGSGTLGLTNLTVTANQTLDGDGGGIALFEGGTVSINGSRITNNNGRGNLSATVGGGIFVGSNLNATASNLTITDSSLTGNTMTGNLSPDGGAIYLFNNTGGGATSYQLRSVTISSNSARQGGGIAALEPITINNAGSLGPSVISGNSSITTACSPSPCGTTGDGGGLYLNGSGTNSITKATITGNSTAGHGGGIAVGTNAAAGLAMVYSRLAGNTATLGGSNQFDATAATITVINNWWGTNSPAGTISNTGGGTTTFDPFITLVHTASPSTIRINQSSTLTASMNQDNHNTPIGAANLDVISGLPVTFNNAVLGTIPQAQPETLNASGVATATYNAGGVGGQGHADASVDQATVTADIVVLQPPSITKSFAPTRIVLSTGVSTLTLGITNANVVPINASFTDTFPSGIVVAAAPNSSNTCGSTFTPAAGATSVTWTNASLAVGSCTIKVDVKGTLEGVLSNSVTINSADAGNGNTPSADLTVYVPPVLAIAKSHLGTFTQGSTAAWDLQVSNTASSVTGATDGSTVTVLDTLPSGYTLASFTGGGWACSGTNAVTCTSTAAVAGNGGTFPLITLTVNVPPASPASVSNTGKVFGGGDVVHVDAATAATGSDTVTVNGPAHATSTTLSTSISPSTPGQSVTFTATVTDTTVPGAVSSGTVTFREGATILAANVALNGSGAANFTTTTLSVGTHTITADYSGVTGTYSPSTGNTTQVVATHATTTSVSTSISPSTFGQSVTFTATVTDNVAPGPVTSGTVTFKDGATILASGIPLDGSGHATFITSALTPGLHTITADYSGTAVFQTSTGSTNQTVIPSPAHATTTTVGASPNPSSSGQAVTFTATVLDSTNNAAVTTGTVNFREGATALASNVALNGTGQATFSTSSLTVGPHIITADYSGVVGTFGASSGSVTQTVNPPSGATYTVSKDFTDNSTASATINLTCTNATPDAASKAATEVPSAPAVFNLTSVTAGAVCTATEGPIAGYTQQSTTCVPNTPFAAGDAKSCTFVNAPVAAPVLVAPTLTKTFGTTAMTLGGTTSMTFTITNPNASALTHVAFTDNLPGLMSVGGGIVLATPTGLTPPVAPCGGTVTALAGGATLSLSNGTLPANGSCSFSVNVYAFRAGTVNNTTSTVTSNAPAGAAATATATIAAPSSGPIVKGIQPVVVIPTVGAPQLAKAFDPTKTNPFLPFNVPAGLTFTLTNPNGVYALTGMGFTDNLPAGLVVATPSGIVNNCAGSTVTAAAGVITVSGASLGSGANCTITVNVVATGPASTTLMNQTTPISSTEGGTGNSAQATVAVGASPHKGID